MFEEIALDEKVIITALSYQRITYPQFTPLSKLPKDLQALAMKDKLVEKYGKIHKPVESNVDYKQKYEKAQREIESLTGTVEKLNAEIAKLNAKPAVEK